MQGLYSNSLMDNEYRLNTSWKAASFVVVVLAVWMLSGLLNPENTPLDNTASIDPAELMLVQIETTQSSVMSRELRLQGQLAAIRDVTVRAQTNGIVEKIITKKGARVRTDDTLVKLDEADRGNLLNEALAAVKSARSEQAAALSLRRQRLQSEVQLQQTEAVLESALATLASVELDIGYTSIRAPFAGVVNTLPVEHGTLVERGDVIAQIVDDSAFKAHAMVSQQSLSQLFVGQSVSVKLITGENLQGSLSFISSIADPGTRSFAIEALIDNSDNTIAAGISATFAIPTEQVDATFITPSSLSLGSDGTLGVKALDDDNRVAFLAIEIVSTTVDGAWVTGIPTDTRLITLGQGFVNAGEQVRTQNDATN